MTSTGTPAISWWTIDIYTYLIRVMKLSRVHEQMRHNKISSFQLLGQIKKKKNWNFESFYNFIKDFYLFLIAFHDNTDESDEISETKTFWQVFFVPGIFMMCKYTYNCIHTIHCWRSRGAWCPPPPIKFLKNGLLKNWTDNIFSSILQLLFLWKVYF